MSSTSESLRAPADVNWLRDAKIISIVSVAHFVSHVHVLLLPPIFLLVKDHFGTSYGEIALALTAFNVMSALLQTPAGFLVDRIGARVTLIQRSANILRDHSEDASDVVQKAFVDEGIELFAGTKIEKITQNRDATAVTFLHDGKRVVRRARHLFNALGREPNIAGLDLAAAGVRIRPHGQIIINRWQQTNVPHIYAAGDCSGPHEIVHVAIQQGELAALDLVEG